MFRTGNPTLSPRVFSQATPVRGSQAMTLQGTAFKGGVLATLALGTAMYTWGLVHKAVDLSAGIDSAMPWFLGGLAVAVVAGLVTSFVPRWAGLTAPIYALGEGLVLGTISAMADLRVPGVVLQAGSLTLLTLVSLAIVYQMGWIRATRGFVLGLSAAMGAICLMYLASFVMRMMGMSIPYIHGSGPIGIGVSVIVVIVAALNLILDFDQIEQGVRYGAPKYMEWYGAFGLMVTLVWLYLEILRLLMKLAARRD